jgi:hypothetical protein
MSNIVLIKGKVLVDVSDIQDIKGLEYQGGQDEYLSDKFVVRIFSKTPFIDILCDELSDAQMLYKNLMKSRQVVDINELRYGK